GRARRRPLDHSPLTPPSSRACPRSCGSGGRSSATSETRAREMSQKRRVPHPSTRNKGDTRVKRTRGGLAAGRTGERGADRGGEGGHRGVLAPGGGSGRCFAGEEV